MSEREENKKEKQRKKNLKNFLIFTGIKKLIDNVDIGTPSTSKKTEGEKRPASAARTVKDEECSEKLATVYKSLELRKREAKDRWNRFSGTEGGGGRGR